jgi:hypothetical protein
MPLRRKLPVPLPPSIRGRRILLVGKLSVSRSAARSSCRRIWRAIGPAWCVLSARSAMLPSLPRHWGDSSTLHRQRAAVFGICPGSSGRSGYPPVDARYSGIRPRTLVPGCPARGPPIFGVCPRIPTSGIRPRTPKLRYPLAELRLSTRGGFELNPSFVSNTGDARV